MAARKPGEDMNSKKLIIWCSVFCLSAMPLRAQEAGQVEQLKKQLQQLQENFERLQREQREQIEALTRKLDELTKAQAGKPAAAEPKTAEQKKLEDELAAELAKGTPVDAKSGAQDVPKTWSPSQT